MKAKPATPTTAATVIPPTIGRRVLVFVPDAFEGKFNNASTPFDGGICYVHSDNMINVSYADHDGVLHNKTSVPLHDRAQDTADKHGEAFFAVWMPYQFEQAQRAAQKHDAPNPGYAGGPPDAVLRPVGEGDAS
jgi:hypothetical protein